ncbi:MAG: EAL domain-containing protein [Vicinamibacteria bacterium]|nr:EAL domain-containing protein [Vicinamibacteria bacterium]
MNVMNWQEIFDSVGLLYVLESAPFAASIVVDEKFVWCNEAFLRLIGATDRSEVIAHWAHEFLDPEFLPAVRERVSRLSRGESNPPMEMRLLRRDGRKTYAEVRSVPFDARGKQAYVALSTDITERKATEAALRDSEARYRSLVESTPDGILIHRNGKPLFVNKALMEIVGAQTAEDLLSHQVADLVFPEDMEAIATRTAILESGESVEPMVLRLKRLNGEVVLIRVDSHQVEFEGQPALRAFIRVMTESMRAEQALRESEERYRQLVEASPDGIAVSQGGKLLLVNPAYLQLLGATSIEELQSKRLTEYVHPDFRDIAEGRLRAVELGLSAPPIEQKAVRLDGSIIDIEAQSEPIVYEKGAAILSIIRNISQRKRSEQALVDSEHRYRQLIELLPDPVFVLDGERVVFSNAGTRRLLDLSPELADRPLELVHLAPEADRVVLRELMEAVALGKRPRTSEIRLNQNTGQVSVEVRAAAIDMDGRKGALIIARDLSQRQKAEELQSALYRIAQASTRSLGIDALFSEIHDIVGELMYAKNFFIALLDEEGTHLSFPYFKDEFDAPPPLPLPVEDSLSGYVIRTGEPLLVDLKAIDDLERSRTVKTYGHDAASWIGVPLICGNATFGILVVQSYDKDQSYSTADRDLLTFVSGHIAETIERRQKDEQIQSLAYLDSLTGLPNRFLFDDRLDTALALAERHRTTLAVLFVDLDHFKLVNDTLGHSVGDGVLRLVSARLAGCLRESDTLARRGGDEFIAILPDTDQRGATNVAQKLVDSLRPPLDAAGSEVLVTASVGIAMFPDNGTDRDTLLKAADLAMYGAKEMGRDTHQVFSAALRDDVERRVSMERGLRTAIVRSKLVVYFQPIIDTKLQRPVAVEALVRWPHEQGGGMTMPSDFIPLAENTGLIVPLGELVLRESTRAIRDVPCPPGGAPLNLAINVAVRQLSNTSFVDDVLATLSAESFPASRLHFEITETAALSEGLLIGEQLRRLKEAGASIAIDDFGVGYSSLSRLRQMPVDMLKIDASFIRDMIEDPDDAAIAKAVVSLGHALNMRVVAEGVERLDQQQALESWGCDLMQGYLYSKPIPIDELHTWLRQFPSTT